MSDGSRNLQSNFCPIQREYIVTFVACLLPKGEAKSNANQDIGFPRVQNSEIQAHLFPKWPIAGGEFVYFNNLHDYTVH